MDNENLTIITGHDLDAAIHKTLQQFSQVVATMRQQRAQLVLSWAGGRAIETFATQLRAHPLPWQSLNFFMLDERRVSIDHADSNFGMLSEHLFRPLLAEHKIENNQVHPFICDTKEPLNVALTSYAADLAALSSGFDIIVASIGEDGHMASLFPHHPALKTEAAGYIAIDDAPKPPLQRVSATPALIRASRCAFVFAWGEGKRQAVSHFFDETCAPAQCPAKLLWQIPELYLITDVADRWSPRPKE